MFVKYVCKNNNSSSRLTFNEKELKIILIFQVFIESALIISSSWKNFKKGRSDETGKNGYRLISFEPLFKKSSNFIAHLKHDNTLSFRYFAFYFPIVQYFEPLKSKK